MKQWGFSFLILAVVLLGFAINPVHATTINFDNLSAGVKSGDVYAALGVKFATCQSPNAVALNSVITLSQCTQGFQILTNDDAISPPSFAVARGLGTKDVLMSFTNPVNYVEVFSDDNPTEAPDMIRLIALEPTGKKNQFKVVAIDISVDNKTGFVLNNRLVVSSKNPFSAALFQTMTEAEGFDNLSFTLSKLPEPDCDEKRLDPKCLEEFGVDPQWVEVGCEIIDCCPGCPGDTVIDWIIRVEGDPFLSVVLFFENLAPEVARGLKIEGNVKWLGGQRLEILSKGVTTIRGLRADPNSMLPSMMSPRMSLERVTAVAPNRRSGRVQRSGTLEITVEQTIDGRVIDKSQRVYRYRR
jgi:hypothetical protein